MNVLRTAIPLVEGLLSVLFEARVVIISAFRSEAPPFPVQIDYVRIHKIEPEDTLIELTSVRILMVGVTPALARDLVHTRVFFEDIQTFATLEQALRAVIAHTRES